MLGNQHYLTISGGAQTPTGFLYMSDGPLYVHDTKSLSRWFGDFKRSVPAFGRIGHSGGAWRSGRLGRGRVSGTRKHVWPRDRSCAGCCSYE